jgi:hypothetical protein
MLPILKQGGVKGPIVKDLQEALNLSKKQKLDSKLPDLVVDGTFGPKTEARVKEYQKPRALVPDGRVGPLTRGFLFKDAYDVISGAQERAIGWTMLARAAIEKMLAFAKAVRDGQPADKRTVDPIDREALFLHFHIDLPGFKSVVPAGGTPQQLNPDAVCNFLVRILEVYNAVLRTISIASVENEVLFFRSGRHLAEFHTKKTARLPTAYTFPENDKNEGVFFAPRFTRDDGSIPPGPQPMRNFCIGTVIHESAHFIGQSKVRDFVYGQPFPLGQPGADAPGKFYHQIGATEGVGNASSYEYFAEHVTFRADVRFTSAGDDLEDFIFATKCGGVR